MFVSPERKVGVGDIAILFVAVVEGVGVGGSSDVAG